MKIAAIQMVSGTSVERNVVQAGVLLEQAAAQGAELVVLPEYFCLMGLQDTDKLKVQEPFGTGPIQDFLSQSARRLGIWIVGGTLPLATTQPARARNSSLVFHPEGRCVARYDKIHLFRFDNGAESYDESCVLERGSHPVTFDLPSTDGHTYRIGMSICYDLRFPELYRQLRSDILLVPSAFTFTTGQAHWEILLRARAIENLAFVLASAQGGAHENGRKTWGHSMIVEPWGQILAEHGQGSGVVVAEVMKETLQSARSRLPALDHAVLALPLQND
jgi:nitrilase